MFDLLMRDVGGAGVPVPLPGRGLVYLGSDGLIYAKRSDGAVMALPSGPQGAQGPQGVAGVAGAAGAPGSAGAAGAQGAQGLQGVAGAAGADGAPGAAGAQGLQGPQGLQGVAGAAGAPGAAGAQGLQGVAGAAGADGAPGAVTLNAVKAAISVPFSATAAQVVTANAADIWAGGGVEFDASGLYTKTTTAANMIFTIYAGSLLVASLTITLGTTARTNAAWSLRGSLRISGGVAVMQMVGRADFVSQPAPVGKEWGAYLVAGYEVLSVYMAMNTTTATLKSAGGKCLRVA